MSSPFEITVFREEEKSLGRYWIPEVYEFKKAHWANEWKWVTRLRKWLFLKFTAKHYEEFFKVERHRINPDDLMQAIFKQKHEVAKCFDCLGKQRLLIGSRTMADLMSRPDARTYMTFEAEMHYAKHDEFNGTQRFIIGLPITVIPWMEGILVIPEERAQVKEQPPPCRRTRSVTVGA